MPARSEIYKFDIFMYPLNKLASQTWNYESLLELILESHANATLNEVVPICVEWTHTKLPNIVIFDIAK